MRIRVFGYRGVTQIPYQNKQFSGDSIWTLQQPYLWGAAADSVGATPVTINDDDANGKASVIRVEVPDGEKIRYEINYAGREGGTVSPTQDSPSLTGITQFNWGEGWSFSFIEADAT